MAIPRWVREIKFDKNGLVPAIVQDARSKEVLMVAYMNSEAVLKTLRTKKTHFYSRSRKKIWLKGETSGHIQKVKSLSLDCDGDAVRVLALQVGGACHTGYRSCFYRDLEQGRWKAKGKPIFNPDKVYGSK